MSLPNELKIALKEWAVVCSALAHGRQIVLLRKGGIYESAGEFELEHRRFLLFPTYLHQKAAMLKDEAGVALAERMSEPDRITLALAGEGTDIIQLRSRSQMESIDKAHIWSPALIDMRFSYRPENPLYLLLVRAYQLEHNVTIANTPAYAGCKSWVPLEEPVAAGPARPVLDDAAYERVRADILTRIAE